MANASYQVDNLYSITDMIAATEDYPPAPQFLRNSLFNKVELTWGDQIAVDYLRGTARLAPYTSRYKRAIAAPRNRFRTQWMTPPDIKVSRDIRALDLMNRMPGENSVTRMNAEERLAEWQVLDYLDLDKQISRQEEKQCADILFNGKLIIKDGDDKTILQELDFGAVNATVIDPTTYWDTTLGNPLADLQLIKRVVSSSGYMPSFYVLGCDATTAFLANANVLKSYSEFNYRPGSLDPKQLEELENFGVSMLGTYWGMPLYSYEGMYQDPDDGLMHYYMPPNQILVASKALQNRLAYGAVVQTEEAHGSGGEGWGTRAVGTYMLPRVPQYVTDGGEDALKFRLWSRPLAIPVNMKTWSTATVCTLHSAPIASNNP